MLLGVSRTLYRSISEHRYAQALDDFELIRHLGPPAHGSTLESAAWCFLTCRVPSSSVCQPLFLGLYPSAHGSSGHDDGVDTTRCPAESGIRTPIDEIGHVSVVLTSRDGRHRTEAQHHPHIFDAGQMPRHQQLPMVLGSDEAVRESSSPRVQCVDKVLKGLDALASCSPWFGRFLTTNYRLRVT